VDVLNEHEVRLIESIAGSEDDPLLMVNLNRYKPGNFPDGPLYAEWREVNAEMIGNVGGKILWALPVEGHVLTNGPAQPLDEILAYWYPSHQAFLDMRNFDVTKKNFELRKELVDFAIVHRCNGENPPLIPSR
jgi:hypothetical protein